MNPGVDPGAKPNPAPGSPAAPAQAPAGAPAGAPFGGRYAGRRVLVTGHTGFKGSWLSAWLLRLGARVRGVSIGLPGDPCHFAALGLAGRLEHRVGDVRDLAFLRREFEDFAPEVVFHLAAQALVRPSYEDPVGTFTTNTVGTLHALECVRAAPSVRAAVLVTSDKAYRNREWLFGYRETDELGGDDPYSASKGAAELVIRGYLRSFLAGEGAPRAAAARAGNVIGGGDWARDRIVPDAVRAWSRGEAVRLRQPRSTRPWQHALEPLSGYLALGAALLDDAPGVRGEAFNFGPDAAVAESVGGLVAALAARWPGARVETDPAGCGAMPEAGLLKLCCDKALARLGWRAALDFPATVAFTADWYRAFHAGGADVWALTAGQIAAYEEAARRRGLPWTGGRP